MLSALKMNVTHAAIYKQPSGNKMEKHQFPLKQTREHTDTQTHTHRYFSMMYSVVKY